MSQGAKQLQQILLSALIVGISIAGILGIASNTKASPPAEKQLIYVSFLTHQEGAFIKGLERIPGRRWTLGPRFYTTRANNIIERWERAGIKGEYATMGVALQQLADASPETIEKIKHLKLPVTHYCDVGHQEPGAVGGKKNLAGLTLDEAIRAIWEFETQTLVPNWHLENGKVIIGNPRAGEPMTFEELPEYNLPQEEIWLYGGLLAAEKLLGIIPMDFFQARFENLGRDEETTTCPINAVTRALGMGSYEVGYNEGSPVRVGLSAEYLADNWPRDMAMYARGPMGGGLENLLSRPDDFKVVWPDPMENQWKPENSALEFFRKTYGVNSFEDMLRMDCPVDYIKQLMTDEEKARLLAVINRQTENQQAMETDASENWDTRLLTTEEALDWQDYLMALFDERRDIPDYLQANTRTLEREIIVEAAKYLMFHWPQSNHDGDFGGPPDYVETDNVNLSLAEAFQAFAYVLEHFVLHERVPNNIAIQDVLGPIDYPVYELPVEPKLDPEKVLDIRGWQPYEMDKQYFPDAETIAAQGLLGTSFRPLSVMTNEVNVMQAAVDAARFIRKNGHIPGSIEMFMPVEPRPPKEGESYHSLKDRKVDANAAELLYGMAQLVYILNRDNFPGPVRMISVKIIEDQICRYVVNSTPISYMNGRFQANWMDTGFIWREWVPPRLLNAGWTYKP